MIKSGAMVQPVINLLRDRMLSVPVLAMDETGLQVLKEPGKAAQSQSYLWVQRGGPPGLLCAGTLLAPGGGSSLLLALSQPVRVSTDVLPGASVPFEHERARDDVIQQLAIVTDEEDGSLVGVQQ